MNKTHFSAESVGLEPTLAMEEASRCLLCLDAPCSKSCPAGTDPAKFIRSIRFKNVKGAAATIRSNNPLGGICARVCPTEKYCQLGCSRSGIDKPIDIARLQRFATDLEASLGMKFQQAKPNNGKRVAIIGSGPAGLAAAAMLAREGTEVDLYERKPKLGGYLRYGIPSYRLNEEVLDREIGLILDLGVKAFPNQEIKSVGDLEGKYDAVIVSVGYSKGKMLSLFEGNKRAMTAVEFLAKAKKKGYRVKENVLVIGGGDVAMDVAVSAKKLGAKQVSVIAYETNEEFKASRDELALARDHKVSIFDGFIPTKVSRGNTVIFEHRYVQTAIKIKADQIVLAVGQELDRDSFALDEAKNEFVHEPGNKVYYAGDIAPEDKTVVYAVRKGKMAAEAVLKDLGVNQ